MLTLLILCVFISTQNILSFSLKIDGSEEYFLKKESFQMVKEIHPDIIERGDNEEFKNADNYQTNLNDYSSSLEGIDHGNKLKMT